MGFDYAMNAQSDDETLFDGIRDKFTKAGYELPKLIFWNVDAWNNAKIPMQENKKRSYSFIRIFYKSNANGL